MKRVEAISPAADACNNCRMFHQNICQAESSIASFSSKDPDSKSLLNENIDRIAEFAETEGCKKVLFSEIMGDSNTESIQTSPSAMSALAKARTIATDNAMGYHKSLFDRTQRISHSQTRQYKEKDQIELVENIPAITEQTEVLTSGNINISSFVSSIIEYSQVDVRVVDYLNSLSETELQKMTSSWEMIKTSSDEFKGLFIEMLIEESKGNE